jgi:SM-20-related protein
MNPVLLDDFFPAELYGRLRDTVRSAPMHYGSKSNNKTDPHGHWSWKPIHDSTHNLADLTTRLQDRDLLDGWNFLRINRCKEMKLTRCYANGYTYGTDGYMHTDSERVGELTVIIYICDASEKITGWPLDWAGETVCTDGKTYWSYLPRPNRVLIVPSNMLHAARAVSRKCTELRLTLMYKCRPARDAAFEMQSAWLRDAGALDIKHATGSLHDHLMRCHQLLQDKGWDQPTHILIAAGLHSVYGTNAFAKQLLVPDPSKRAEVAGMFGREAEELAYTFSLLDRPQTLNTTPDPEGATALSLRFNAVQKYPNRILRSLQLIECANLADQGSLDNWPNLKQLWKGESK